MFETFHQLEGSNHAQPRTTALLSIQENLMPLSWHMPISKSPFRYAIAIREENYSFSLLKNHKSFTLNFLPFGYETIIDKLGRVHGEHINKLQNSQLKYQKDTHGNALLEASEFIYSCELIDTYTNGDHTIFIADVTTIFSNPKSNQQPIFFMGRGRYATMQTPIQVPYSVQ
jgi:flavin reductase (DIM6/NTAB) family NADH-FMN oxidoreductase RutF